MLNVQKFLIDNGHDALYEQYKINTVFHETDPLVILNYDQIESSPKTHPIVRECRGLVLHSQTHDLVARSFSRFFNWGEVQDEMKNFDFSNFAVQTKEDGSLIVIYNFCNEWRVNTRGSFARDNMQFQTFTWEDGILQAMGVSNRAELDMYLDPNITYVGEFCSPWNKIVRRYQQPVMYLLTAFRGMHELTHEECDKLALEIEYTATSKIFVRPQRLDFKSLEEVQEYLSSQAAADPTYEGVVLRDANNNRWKIKSSTYLGLHRLGSCKDGLFNPKNLLPFVLSGEKDELLTYFSEVTERFNELELEVQQLYSQLEVTWRDCKDIELQKDFALAIKGRTPFTGILFDVRKRGENDLQKTWRNSADLILKVLKN